MKKTYTIQSTLSPPQLEQLHNLNKKLAKSPNTIELMITPQWKLKIEDQAMELELMESPFANWRIEASKGVMPSIARIGDAKDDKEDKEDKGTHGDKGKSVFRVAEKDGFLVKIVKFVDDYLMKDLYCGDKKIELDLKELGYFKLSKFETSYYNRKGIHKWSLVNCSQPSRYKLHDLIKLQPSCKSKSKPKQKPIQQTTLSRKFSLHSFKSYTPQKPRSLQKPPNPNLNPQKTPTRTRQKSLPSIPSLSLSSQQLPQLHQQSKQNHYKIIQKMQKLKEQTNQKQAKKQQNYLKIQRKQKGRKDIRLKSLLLPQKEKEQYQEYSDLLAKKAAKEKESGVQGTDREKERGGDLDGQDEMQKKTFGNISQIDKNYGNQKNQTETQLFAILREVGDFRGNRTNRTFEQAQRFSMQFSDSRPSHDSSYSKPSPKKPSHSKQKPSVLSIPNPRTQMSPMSISNPNIKPPPQLTPTINPNTSQLQLQLQSNPQKLQHHILFQKEEQRLLQLKRQQDLGTVRKFLKGLAGSGDDQALIREIYQAYVERQMVGKLKEKEKGSVPKSVYKAELANKKRRLSCIPQQSLTVTQLTHLKSSMPLHNPQKSCQHLRKILEKFEQIPLKKLQDITNKCQLELINQLFLLFEEQNQKINEEIQMIIQEDGRKKDLEMGQKEKFQWYRFEKGRYVRTEKVGLGEIGNYCRLVMPEPEKQLVILMNQYTSQQKDQVRKYYQMSHFMPYYFTISQNLTALFLGLFSTLQNPSNQTLITLPTIHSLPKTITEYLQNIDSLYSKFINFYHLIPHKVFHIQQFQLLFINQLIQTRKDQVTECAQLWHKEIGLRWTGYEEYLADFAKRKDDVVAELRMNRNSVNMKDIQAALKDIQGKLDKLTREPTFMRNGKYILDCNQAKLNLINGYESMISDLYDSVFKISNQISAEWSKEMARTQRLQSDELAEQEQQIYLKIRYLTKKFISLSRFLFVSRRYFYIIPNLQIPPKQIRQLSNKTPKARNEYQQLRKIKISSNSNSNSNANTNTNTVRNSRNLMKKSKNSETMDREIFTDNFMRALSYCYSMTRKNNEKMSQISFLVHKHKQKMIKVSKSLQQCQKKNKSTYTELSIQLKKLLRQIKTKTDLLNNEQKLTQISKNFKAYQQISSNLHEEMERNGVIVWEDDDFVQTNLEVCMKVIGFLSSDIYVKLHYQTVEAIRSQHFSKYQKNLGKLMTVIKGHRFEEFFKDQYQLSQREYETIDMILFKDYTVSEIEQIYTRCGVDIRPTVTTSKMDDILRLIRSKPAISSQISRIYHQRKKQKYDKNLQKPLKLNIQLSQPQPTPTHPHPYSSTSTSSPAIKILNSEQITLIIQDELKHSSLPIRQKQLREDQLQVLKKVMQIYQCICQHQVMLEEIGTQMREEDHVQILVQLEKLKSLYNSTVLAFQEQRSFLVSPSQSQSPSSDPSYLCFQKLLALHSSLCSHKISQKFYHYLSQQCSRLMMIPYHELIYLMDWRSQFKILRNVKILFTEICDIQFGDGNSIVGVYVSRGASSDRFGLVSGPIQTDNIAKYGKFIRNLQSQIHKSLNSMIQNCNGRAGQIKILNWHLYFTQQVQQQIITNSSLKTLQSRLQQTILQITSDLRYDIQNHKQQQISQLNTFVHYLRGMSKHPTLDSYEWTRTIRAYEKNKRVMIQQNNLEFYYGFEPKAVQVLHALDWDMGLSVGYGDQWLATFYKYKAYILGVPYFNFTNFANSYLSQQKNLFKFLSTLQTNHYICSISQPQKSQQIHQQIFNQLHKQIMNYLNIKLRNLEFKHSHHNSSNLNQSQNQSQGHNQSWDSAGGDGLFGSGYGNANGNGNGNGNLSAMMNQSYESVVGMDSQLIGSVRRRGKKLTTQTMTLEKNSSMGFVNARGRLSLHMCYDKFQKIPSCFLSMYRSRNPRQFQPQTLSLKINLLLESSCLNCNLKSKLIWRLIKLTKSLSILKIFSNQTLTGIITNIIKIIEKQDRITKEIKQEIYCSVVENFITDYDVVVGIVNQVFKVGDFGDEGEVDGLDGAVMTKKQLIKKVKSQYDEICKNNKEKKPIIIYGEQPSCKSTFIVDTLGLKLGEVDGYIESIFAPPFEPSHSTHSPDSYQLTPPTPYPYPVIQAGHLFEVDPSILPMSHLLYVPSIPLKNNDQYLDELKQNFCLAILDTQSETCNHVMVDKLWTICLQMHKIYCQIPQKNAIQLPNFLSSCTKIFTYFLNRQLQHKILNPQQQEYQTMSQKQTKIREKYQIFLIICYEILAFSLSTNLRKEFMNSLQSQLDMSRHKIKLDFKMEEIDNISYSKEGDFVKYDNTANSKNTVNVGNKQRMFLTVLMNKELAVIGKYCEIGMNTWVNGSTMQQLRHIIGARKNGGLGKSDEEEFILDVKMNMLRSVYGRLDQIYERRNSGYNPSKGIMLSGQIFTSSKGSLFGYSDRNIVMRKEGMLIIVEDVHLATEYNMSELAVYLSRASNPIFPNPQTYLLYNLQTPTQQHPKSRLTRHLLQIHLPQLKLQNIYKFRSNFMLNQQQAYFTHQIFKLNLFQDQDFTPYQLNQSYGHTNPNHSHLNINTHGHTTGHHSGSFVQNSGNSMNMSQVNSGSGRDRCYRELEMDFSIETIGKMPSQFYTKYILNRLFLLMNSAVTIQFNRNCFMPDKTINKLIACLESSSHTSGLAQRVTAKKYGSFYLTERDGKHFQIQTKKVQAQIQTYIKSLPPQKQPLAIHLSQSISLTLSPKSLLLKSDQNNLLSSLSCLLTNRKKVQVSHNYIKQITNEMKVLMKRKEIFVTFMVPEYLLFQTRFCRLFGDVVDAKEVFVEDQGMFAFWWEVVLESQYVSGSTHQYRKAKDQLTQALTRTNFIVNLNNLSFRQAINLITSPQQPHPHPHSHSHSYIQPQPHPQPRPTILTPNISYFQSCNQSPSSSSTIPKQKQSLPNSSQLLKKLVLINLELTLENQMEIVDKNIKHYVEFYQVPNEVMGYVRQVRDFLGMILREVDEQNRKKLQDNNELSQQSIKQDQPLLSLSVSIQPPQSPIFQKALQSIPKILSKITKSLSIFKDKKSGTNIDSGTIQSILDQEKMTTIQLIQNIGNRITMLKIDSRNVGDRLGQYEGCRARMAARLGVVGGDNDEEEGVGNGNQEENLVNSRVRYFQKLQKSHMFHQLLSGHKQQFLQCHGQQQAQSFQTLPSTSSTKSIKIHKQNQQKLQQIIKQLTINVPRREEEEICQIGAMDMVDFIVEVEEERGDREMGDHEKENGMGKEESKGKGRKGFGDYLVGEVGFLRLWGIDQGFVKLMLAMTEQEYQDILTKISKTQHLIQNYQQFQTCLEYLRNISKLLSKHYHQPSSSSSTSSSPCQNTMPQILKQFQLVQYINLIDTLGICNNIITKMRKQFEEIDRMIGSLGCCIKFLLEIGNYRVVTKNNNDEEKDQEDKEEDIQEIDGKEKEKEKEERLGDSWKSSDDAGGEEEEEQYQMVNIDQIFNCRYEKNYDRQIKLQIFQTISCEILSKIPRNAKLYYQIHRRLKLQSTKNILFALDNPKLMCPYKSQQIQNLIFAPLLQSPYNPAILSRQIEPMAKAQKAQPAQPPKKRLSIYNPSSIPRPLLLLDPTPNPKKQSHEESSLQSLTSNKSYLQSTTKLPKFVIVYDPYSEMVKYIQSRRQTVNNMYRKIVYLRRDMGDKGEIGDWEVLRRLNSVPTFYLVYFRVEVGQGEKYSYKENLRILNEILGILRVKQQRGQSQNDKLIILVNHEYLCQDIKNNAEFSQKPSALASKFPQKNNSPHHHSHTKTQTHTRTSHLTPEHSIPEVNIVSLMLTEVDMLESFKEKLEENYVVNQNTLRNRKYKQQRKSQILSKSGLLPPQPQQPTPSVSVPAPKSLQILHEEYSTCKNYLSILIRNLIDQTQHYSSLPPDKLQIVIKTVEDYQNRKSQLLNQYCTQKLLNYQYYLDEGNLGEIGDLYGVVRGMLGGYMVPGDFVAEIGNLATIQQLISEDREPNQGIQTHKTQQRKLIFYQQEQPCQPPSPTLTPSQSPMIKKFQHLSQLYEQHKSTLSSHIYSINNPQTLQIKKQKILNTILSPHQIFILVYENIQNWILREFIQNMEKGKMRIIFDEIQERCYQIFLDVVINWGQNAAQNGGNNGNADPRALSRVVFVVHWSKVEWVKELLHAVKIFWI